MLKFLRWFMKLFRPDSERFVKNINMDSGAKGNTGNKVATGKKAVHEKDMFFWIPSSKIISIKKNSQGFTNEILLASGMTFSKIDYTGKFTQSARKQGLSRVSYHLEFKLNESDDLTKQAPELKDKNNNITVLHINRFGDGFLYGEQKGLTITEIENNSLVLDGSDDNVFYEMTKECLDRAVPSKE